MKYSIFFLVSTLILLTSVSCKKNVIEITTTEVTGVSVTSAYSGGNITNDGGNSIVLRGVCYSTSASPSLSNASYTQDGNGTGEFTSKLINLKANTTYHVRAYAKNTKGVTYGEERTFKTDPYFSSTTPIVQTNAISNTDTLGFKLNLNGEILHPGGAEVTEKGFVYATKMGPSISDSKIISTDGGIAFSGQFTFEFSTLYYVKAYAINSYGIAYGEEIQVLIERAKPKIATSQVTEIDSTSAISGGEVLTSGGLPILDRGMCWTTHPGAKITDNFVSAGSGLGVFTATMKGLSPSTIYYCRSYATTSDGTTYGNEYSFKTVVSKLYIGMEYKGGILFYLNPVGGGGLIVITNDLSSSYAWGCAGVEVSGAKNTGVGSGVANSQAILSTCSGMKTAAKLCDDLVYGTYNDWYLPSMDELGIMYKNIKITDLEKFSSGYYWSSNEKNATTAYRYGFLGGNQGEADKSTMQYVRAIRKFN